MVAKYLWPAKNLSGSSVNYLKNVSDALQIVSKEIKYWFFHPSWKHKQSKWQELVAQAQNAEQLARALEELELHLRPCFKRTGWFDSLGQSSLCRFVQDDKRDAEARKIREKNRKNAEQKAEEYLL